MSRIPPLLETAVSALGGSPRRGQQDMAEAVGAALDNGSHLLVQAGTGTGKSLAYLVPAVEYAVRTGERVIVSTATLALQAQIIDRDLPRMVKAIKAPFPYVSIMPTGGVSIDNMADWFKAGVTCVGAGSNLTAAAATGDFAGVTVTAKAYHDKFLAIQASL